MSSGIAEDASFGSDNLLRAAGNSGALAADLRVESTHDIPSVFPWGRHSLDPQTGVLSSLRSLIGRGPDSLARNYHRSRVPVVCQEGSRNGACGSGESQEEPPRHRWKTCTVVRSRNLLLLGGATPPQTKLLIPSPANGHGILEPQARTGVVAVTIRY